MTVRMAPEEMAMVKDLAKSEGMSASDLVRQFIRRTHAERFGEGRKAKPKR